MLTAEGKSGDSTRVYSTYDARGRLVRVHRLQPGGAMLRLDSLVYDANDRVIRRVDALGLTTSITYDGVGNVTMVVTPGDDTTRYWYGANGRVDSVQVPSSPGRIKYTYEASWGNTGDTYDQLGYRLTWTTYDAYGRRSELKSRAVIRLEPEEGFSLKVYRWSRTLGGLAGRYYGGPQTSFH